MPITVYTGRPGAGKSTKLAETVLGVIYRNARYYEKTGIVRPVYMNFHLNPDLEELFSGCIRHWSNVEELATMKDGDVFIDEIGTFFDARRWQDLSYSLRRWLSQHRKLGVEIYGNAQDFAQIDPSFRRMTTELYWISKLISSRDPTPTKPPIKHIWGICVVYRMNPMDYSENSKENKMSFDSLMWINRAKTDVFNTREEIKPGVFPTLQHIVRYCAEPDCNHKKVNHI